MFTRSITHRIPLQLRQLHQGIVLVRASNDTVVDEYGTTITVEALMRDWLPAFLQHRTISLQHNLPELRGIRGKPFVGLARRVDFAPQLEVEVEVLDPETRALVDAGRITGASLEFVPLESRTQAVGGKESEVYYRLASEPELAGLTLTDLPAVPGAEVLEIRADVLAPWQFAVVDPAVFEARSLADAARLMWFPHHDARTHAVDVGLLERALSDLEAGRFEVPATATLSREEVARRAKAHLERHTALGIGMRTTEENMEQTPDQAPIQERSQQVDLNINLDFRTPAERAAGVAETPTERAAREQPPATERWLQARTAQLEAEGTPQAQAQEELPRLLPEVRPTHPSG